MSVSSANGLDFLTNITCGGNIACSGNIQTPNDIDCENLNATSDITCDHLTVTSNINGLSLSNLNSLDTTSSITTQLAGCAKTGTTNSFSQTQTFTGGIALNSSIVANSTTISASEISMLDGCVTNINTALSGCAKTATTNTFSQTQTFTGGIALNSSITTNSLVISGNEISMLDNCSANIQQQIDGKASTSSTNTWSAAQTYTGGITLSSNITASGSTISPSEISMLDGCVANINTALSALQSTSISGYGGITQPQSGGAIAIANSQLSTPLLDFALYQGSSGDTVLNGAASHALEFKIHNAEYMRIASNGDVGIRQTSPQYELDVNGQINGSQIFTNGLEMIPTAICAYISYLGVILQGGGITINHVSTGCYLIKVNAGILPKIRGYPWISGQGKSMRVSPVSENVDNIGSFYPDYHYLVQIQGGGSNPNFENQNFYFFLI
jgi:hypothetical protein